MQLEELMGGFEEEELLIIKDYLMTKRKKDELKVLEQIRKLNSDTLLDNTKIANILGYENFESYEEIAVYTKGYRILNKIPRLPSNIINNMIKSFKSFQHILMADIEKLDAVEGIGEVRARTIKQSLKRMQEQFIFDNVMM